MALDSQCGYFSMLILLHSDYAQTSMVIFELNSNHWYSFIIMALMRTHGSFMKIHDKKLHVLLSMECFSKPVIIYHFINHKSEAVERNEFCLQVSCRNMGKYQNMKSWKL